MDLPKAKFILTPAGYGKLQKELILYNPKNLNIQYSPGLIPAWDVIAMQWNNDNRP